MQLHLSGAGAHAICRRVRAEALSGREQEILQELADYQPMGRMGTPEEVAYWRCICARMKRRL